MSNKILLLGLTTIFLTLPILYAVLQSSNPPNSGLSNFGYFNAALVDSLGSEMADPRFDDKVINILKQSGFIVDHYNGSNAITNFNAKLPEKAYGLIILRTHIIQGIPTSSSLKLQNMIIIAMGCNSYNELLAETLIQRGVGVYIAWKDYVRVSRADQGVIYLLEHLLIKNKR